MTINLLTDTPPPNSKNTMEKIITPAEILMLLAGPSVEEINVVWIEKEIVFDTYEDVIIEATIWSSGTEVHISLDNTELEEEVMEAIEFIESYHRREMWIGDITYIDDNIPEEEEEEEED